MQIFLFEIYRRNRALGSTGWFHIFIFLTTLTAFFFDAREILGVNAWLKPMKFSISITFFVWTLAWFIGYLSRPKWAINAIGWGVSIAMIVEIICIGMQSVRGTTSHFNISTPLDAAIFGTMGTMILISSLFVLLLLILFFTQSVHVSPLYLWGIRIGLMVFLLGSGVGQMMINQMAHTVGAPDGGPGLPFLNWSTQAGDLRVSHLIGLHGLQIIPIAAYVIETKIDNLSQTQRVSYFAGFVALYVSIGLMAYFQAMSGIPFISS